MDRIGGLGWMASGWSFSSGWLTGRGLWALLPTYGTTKSVCDELVLVRVGTGCVVCRSVWPVVIHGSTFR